MIVVPIHFPSIKDYSGDLSDFLSKPLAEYKDLNGNPRINDGRVDIGAYEGGPPVQRYSIQKDLVDTSVCEGSDITLKLPVWGASVFRDWQTSTDSGKSWSFVNNTDSLVVKNLRKEPRTMYRAVLANPCGYRDTSQEIIIAVNDPIELDLGPDLRFRKDETRTITAPSGMRYYSWSTGDSGESLEKLELLGTRLDYGPNKVYLDLVDSSGCMVSDTVEIYLDYGLAVHPMDDSRIRIYPNPSIDVIFIEGFSGSYHLFDMRGNVLRSKTLSSDATHQLDVGDLSSGMYILTLRSGQGAEESVKLFIR